MSCSTKVGAAFSSGTQATCLLPNARKFLIFWAVIHSPCFGGAEEVISLLMMLTPSEPLMAMAHRHHAMQLAARSAVGRGGASLSIYSTSLCHHIDGSEFRHHIKHHLFDFRLVLSRIIVA